ncbi:LacI family DNA-binding transcriptional regulator [Microbacterium testaceum]|uniref:LacI family transcriptional regulator n=1 Tax=Microbacterium testaceum TaxID=2033 RepID=A0A4Y3QQU2_MICTE|nr:LacI family DNA-binding transcriptional regulator [Microbacterium testaceum]MDZ5144337.1 LacI family transcriptional regulator [Microbacterium testaceum]GEB47299.1 LacI family transcriptional regulator [Microbacterium testaceum]
MTPRKPTLHDVAAGAGVSIAAASFALRGKSGVSAETRDRVTAVARDLGYSVNMPARNLRTARSGAVGLHLPAGTTHLPYYTDFAFGVVEAADRRGLSVILLPHRDDAASGAPASFVDGYVVVDASIEDAGIRALLDSGRPVVSGEHVFGGMGRTSASVAIDHAAALRRLLAHLSERGAQRIAAVLPPDGTAWSRELAETYESWAREHGLDGLSRTVSFVPTAAEIATVVTEIVADPTVDAVVIAPSGSAATALAAAARAGRRVGDDLLVAACVDEPAHALLSPPVTSIDLAARELGAACLELLVEVWDAETLADPVRVAHPRLVVRDSTAGHGGDPGETLHPAT